MARIDSLQAYRSLAVLGIILFHLTFVEAKNAGGDRLLPAFLDWAQLCVDLFFVISGFVMALVTRGRFGQVQEIKRFAFNRAARVYPVYWLYFFLTLSVFLLKPQWVNSSHGEPDLWASFFLLPTSQVSLVMVSWTLTFELWFYLAFTLLMFFRERHLPYCLAAWGLLLVVVNLFYDVRDFPPYLHLMLHPYALQFILGAGAGLLFSSGRLSRLSLGALLVLLALTLLIAMPFAYWLRLFETPSLLRMLLIGATFAALVIISALLEQRGHLRIPTLLRHLGDSSYSTYLSHLLVLGVLGKLWAAVGPWPHSSLDNWLVVLTAVVACLAYGWLAYLVSEKPLMQATARLSNNYFPLAPRGASPA